MVCNLSRPIHGLDLLSVRSNPNVNRHAPCLPIGLQGTAIVINGDPLFTAGGHTSLPDKFVSATKSLQPRINTLLLNSYPFINPTVINDAVDMLFNTLEAAAGQEVDLMEVEVQGTSEAQIKRENEGNRFNVRLITLRRKRHFSQNRRGGRGRYNGTGGSLFF